MMRKEKSRGIFCGFYIKWFITGFEYPWHSYMTYIQPVYQDFRFRGASNLSCINFQSSSLLCSFECNIESLRISEAKEVRFSEWNFRFFELLVHVIFMWFYTALNNGNIIFSVC